MLFYTLAEHRRRNPEQLQFFWHNLKSIFLWPLVCLLLGILLWGLTLLKLNHDKQELEANALKVASSLSKAYAQHLGRTIEQLDQFSLQAKYNWEKSNGTLDLQDLKHKGLFAIREVASLTVFDRDGLSVTSTAPFATQVSVEDRDYFKFHRQYNSTALRIGIPRIGRMTGKEILQLTRRLEDDAGKFDGIMVVAVEPSFFVLFSDDPILGESGVLALVGDDGAVRMQRQGKTLTRSSDPSLRAISKLGTQQEPILLTGSPWFADGKPRFVASQKLDAYPFSAVVALGQEEVLAPYERTRSTDLQLLIAGSLLLLLFAVVSMLLSVRLAWRKHQTEAIRDTYRIATEGGKEGFYMWQMVYGKHGAIADFELVDCNERGATIYGMGRQALVGKKLSELYDIAFLKDLMKIFLGAMESGFYEDEFEVRAGSRVKVEWLHRKFVRSGAGLAVTLRDISQLKGHEREKSRLVTEDALTELPNRYWLVTHLPHVLERAKMNGTLAAVFSIDLDDFKSVNDSSGHSAGDRLLQAVAARLRSALRLSGAAVVRLGGDEFTVILESAGDKDKVVRAANRIVKAFDKPFEIAQRKTAVSASIGIALFPHDGSDVETLLKNADIALYSAKAECRGKFRFYDRQLYEHIKSRLDTKQQLLLAIEEDQFVMHYQPRVDTMTGQLVGMEALVRWLHPERGLVLPNDFIPLAETTGIILALGELVMNKVGAQLASWRREGVPLVPVSVNVSARQFNEGKVKNLISACLASHNIAPELIEIELTESAMMGSFESVQHEVAAINALGIKIHIDDFGTGYSSLSLLRRLNMDVLKVDRSFTWQLGKDKEGEIFFKAIVSMAKALDMRVIAEGVETKEQLHILQSLACDEIQGYFISRPLPANEIPAFIRQQSVPPASHTESIR